MADPKSSTLSRDEALQLFERRRTAWLAEDVAGYLALWREDLVIELPGRSEPVRGLTAYERVVRRSFEHIRPVAWTYHHLAVDADHVLSEWTIEGELRSAGSPVSWRGMAVCRLAGGRIARWREYWDPAALRAQLEAKR